jgi:hypothetical protein
MDGIGAMAAYHVECEAIRAYDMGEIDQWIAWIRPKSLQEWDEWAETHGEDYSNRWA